MGTAVSYAGEPPKESHLKAAILYNLARFSAWEETSGLPSDLFNVCTLSDPDMQDALDGLSGKNIHNRILSVTHLKTYADVSTDCQVLYVSSSYIAESEDIEMLDLSEISQRGILTVGDTSDFLEFGGCISILRRGKKLKFSINQTAMNSANITPSSKILQLSVKPGQ